MGDESQRSKRSPRTESLAGTTSEMEMQTEVGIAGGEERRIGTRSAGDTLQGLSQRATAREVAPVTGTGRPAPPRELLRRG